VRFLGAAGTVTGSRFLLDTPRARVLVDCGLFQGLKELRLRNWAPFPVDPASIDAVLLTHAHVDHCGYLPGLVKHGFRGRVLATAGTHALARVVLPDSGHIQEEDAAYANRKGFSKHAPALPLYTEEDAWKALDRFAPAPWLARFDVAPGVAAEFRPAGHILGAASAVVDVEGHGSQRIVWSGDVGRPSHPLLAPPRPPPDCDVLVLESTYGDREHREASAVDRLAEVIVRTAARGGTVVVPAFAVDRTEVLLWHLAGLARAGRVPDLPVFVDSPMASAALALYRRALEAESPEFRSGLAARGDPFDPGRLVETRSVAESKALNDQRFPSIVISASGMATGGRVLHHLAHRLPDSRNTVFLPGYQAAGTRGRSLQEGASVVKIHGRLVPVAAEIVHLDAFSAHAGRSELLAWVAAGGRPDAVHVVHGEPEAAASLRDALAQELGLAAHVARDGGTVEAGRCSA
jgi:metallo-beta-lactamase family protein